MSTPIGLVHGYGLSGSGSNLWTRAILRALCKQGLDVHVVCQESRPEEFDFISSAITYDAETRPNTVFDRRTEYPGSCTIHRPELEILPVYVAPRRPSDYVRPIPALSLDEIEGYVRRNARALSRVSRDYGVGAYHVNHVVLMSVALQRVYREDGIPYVVLPHGSAIEYVVKKDGRMLDAASSALEDAYRVLALNGEMDGRLRDVFGHVPGLDRKLGRLPVGVDTAQFDAASVEQRPDRMRRLLEMIGSLERGRTPAQQDQLRERVARSATDEDLLDALTSDREYASSAPDVEVDDRLSDLGRSTDPIVVYVGRLIAAKGPQLALLAFPRILQQIPNAHLIIAGTGAIREHLEGLRWALGEGDFDLALRILHLARDHESEGHPEYFDHALAFMEGLNEDDRSDYLAAARALSEPDRATFTGYMDHGPLSQLYAVADVGLFPSVVKEASPLVVPEAAASGTFPIGTDHAGMGDSLKTLGTALPESARPLLVARFDPAHTVRDLADHSVQALERRGDWTEALRRAAVERYDWNSIASDLAELLREASAHRSPQTT